VTSGSTRPRSRRLPVGPLAIGLAILLHGILFGIMFIKIDSHVKQVAAVKALQIQADKPLDIIEATAVDNKVLEEKKERKLELEREKERKIVAEKKRQADKERKRKAEVKRKKEDQVKKKKAEEQRNKALALKKAEKKKKEDAKKKKAAEEKKKVDKEKTRKQAEAKKKKLAEEKKRKAAADKKRKADAERKRKEKAMKAQMAKKAREARASQALSKYVPRIQRKVEGNWGLPPKGAAGCNPTVRVNLAPDGKVLSAKIVKSSGDPYCDSSVKKAFLKASPIPIPLDPDLYSEFKVIDFPFRP
jgi:colicin import membrane protein